MGQWSTKNIDTIIYMLKCFQRASGLSNNLGKSKLLGIAVDEDNLRIAADRIGCRILKDPFNYLGSKVGENMSRIRAWDDIVDNMITCLSKWKMKTLSIGGRLTLIKAVLGSMPIYHIKKLIWVKWSNVLSSKEKGGLGVSSLYALNYALMFKWVWRFTTQQDLLWTRVIKAIYGEDRRISDGSKHVPKSIWCGIVQELKAFKSKCIDFYSFRKKKLGNGAETFFRTMCGVERVR
nr:RNA-directed DNA polymerase, eukaryota, reverse transcriptase zinc-binding domain protein [Tanacetum cinerariifolium]